MWEKCKELQKELVAMRRELHKIPEVGGNLPKTKAYVMARLTEMGIPFTEIGRASCRERVLCSV